MYNKKVLSEATKNLNSTKAPAKKKDKIVSKPVVSTQGYKQGPPPTGSHYRIPGDGAGTSIYNPTPYPLNLIGPNGTQAQIGPWDTNTQHFDEPYMDEFPMAAYGGDISIPDLTDYEKGGFHDDLGKHRKLLRDWTYGQSIGMLQEKQYGEEIKNLPEVTVKPKTLGYITDKRPEYAKGYYDPWGVLDNTLENTVEIFDPTGVSSWDDVVRAEREFGKDSWQAYLERLGSMPLLGKAAKVLKGTKVPMTARQARSYNTTINALQNASRLGRVSDAYQTWDEGFKQYGGDYIETELNDKEIEEYRQGGFHVEEID
jgi:hypothetical protein